MQSAPKFTIALILAALLAACTANDANNANRPPAGPADAANANANAANQIKDDVDELELTIRLPFHPEDAVWREDAFPKNGAPTRKLTAILRFKKEDADKIAAQAAGYRPPAPEIVNTENWFPAELVAQSQMSGDETLKGTSFGANDFIADPFADGKATRIDGTDYFIVELFAK